MTDQAAPALSTVHGVAVAVRDAGLLLRGRSAAGKSRLAEDIAAQAQLRGWFGRLIADDRVALAERGGRVLLAPHPAIEGQVERRGQGIFTVDHERAAVLRLVVDLVDRNAAGDHPPRLPDADEQTTVVAGVRVPRLFLAIGEPGAAQAVLERIDQLGA